MQCFSSLIVPPCQYARILCHSSQVCKFASLQVTQKAETSNASAHSLSIHVVLTFLLIKFPFLLRGCILVLLVFADEVIHIAFSLGEFHFVHALSCIPMQECLATEHGCEILSDTLEHLLDCCGIPQEGHCHLQTLRRNIADSGLDIVGDPLHKVGRVLVLHVQHLLVDLLGRHTSTEQGGSSQVATMARVSSAHHIFSIEHLLGKLWDRECPVLLRAAGSEGRKSDHEEVQAWERNKIHCQLAQISIQLTRKAEASCHAADSCRYEVIQITICWSGELQGSETNVVECLIVKKHAFVGILHQLVEREHCIVRFDDCVTDLGRWYDGECLHDTVRILLTNFRNQQGTHTCTRSSSKGMAELKALKAITSFSLLANNVKHRVDQFGTFCIMSLRPIISSTSLAKHEVIRAEKLAEWTSANAVHGTGLQIHENGAGHVTTSSRLVVIYIDPFKLQVRIAMVCSGGINAMLI